MAQFVLPAPVGAQTNMFSADSNAVETGPIESGSGAWFRGSMPEPSRAARISGRARCRWAQGVDAAVVYEPIRSPLSIPAPCRTEGLAA
eukprot:CAMPEP_0182595138 /NCGR_PEP_ID=MMETSP1324-20130603/81676_1 /TAXON_ID=236786 /ORGANISM="Florenciella sp., Strain RCC1587" /LENGTH=88 /DNA_ID=CAMNT_0024812725 /DNA_START=12 /DNA_END=275 /DNA_ORIENTATION=-